MIALGAALLLSPFLPAPGALALAGQAPHARAPHRSSPHVGAEDRAAIHAYLEAEYAYRRQRLATAGASNAQGKALARRIASECPGVLARAPKARALNATLLGSAGVKGRRLGELERSARQVASLSLELSVALSSAYQAPSRTAALAYAHRLAALHFSSQRLAAYVHALATGAQAEVHTPTAVCADMRSWAASSYTTLTPQTKALVSEVEALARMTLPPLFFAALSGPQLFSYRYADRADRALVKKIDRLGPRLGALTAREQASELALRVKLGVVSEAEAEEQEHPPRRATVLLRARTAAGRRFIVYVSPIARRRLVGPQSCPAPLTIEEEARTRDGNVPFFRENDQLCVRRRHPHPPAIGCDEGVLTISGQLPAPVRSVRLSLSDHRALVSRVALVPRSAGGPAAFYYEALPGRLAPLRGTLTELGAHGKALRRERVSYRHRCAYHAPKLSGGPFSPLVTRRILAGQVPRGPRFTITGARNRHNVFPPLELDVEVEGEEPLVSVGVPAHALTPEGPEPPGAPFVAHLQAGCRPHEYAVVYGLLRDPRDTVLAHTAAGSEPLTPVPIPSALKPKGAVLAYAVLESVPEEVLVKGPAGDTVAHEDLSAQAREEREICQGEAEP